MGDTREAEIRCKLQAMSHELAFKEIKDDLLERNIINKNDVHLIEEEGNKKQMETLVDILGPGEFTKIQSLLKDKPQLREDDRYEEPMLESFISQNGGSQNQDGGFCSGEEDHSPDDKTRRMISTHVDKSIPRAIQTILSGCIFVAAFGVIRGKLKISIEHDESEGQEGYERKIKELRNKLPGDTSVEFKIHKPMKFLSSVTQSSKIKLRLKARQNPSEGAASKIEEHCGTLGAIAKTDAGENIGIASSHFTSEGDVIYNDSGSRKIGTTKWAWKLEDRPSNGAYVDAAGIEFDTNISIEENILGPHRTPISGNLFDFTHLTKLETFSLYKIGAATGLTWGVYVGLVDFKGRKMYMVEANKDKNTVFCSEGDSGAMISVYDEQADKVYPVFFLIGEYESFDAYACYPVEDALKYLGEKMNKQLSLSFQK